MQLGSVHTQNSVLRATRAKAQSVPPAVPQDGSGSTDMQSNAGGAGPQHLMRIVVEAQLVQAGMRNAFAEGRTAFATQYSSADANGLTPSHDGRPTSSLTLRV